MKKLFLLSLCLVAFTAVNAQQKKPDSLSKAIQKNAEAIGQGGNNELKLNLLMSVIGMPEITYERILADNLGLGAAMFIGLGDDAEPYKFGVIPHFRVYFGAKKAAGFFVEGNAAVMSLKDEDDYVYTNPGFFVLRNSESSTNFGLGAAAGAKFLTRNGFLGEAFVGVGRFFGSNKVIEAYPRIGITIGKRF